MADHAAVKKTGWPARASTAGSTQPMRRVCRMSSRTAPMARLESAASAAGSGRPPSSDMGSCERNGVIRTSASMDLQGTLCAPPERSTPARRSGCRRRALPSRPERGSARVDPDVIPLPLLDVCSTTIALGPCQFLFHEALPPGSLLVVRAGAIGPTAAGPDGRRAVIGVLGPGDVVPTDGLARIRADLLALSGVEVTFVPIGEVERLARREPSVAAWLAAGLTHRIDQLQSALAAALTLGVQDRTLGVLRLLAGRWGHRTANETVIDLLLPQDTLAAMVGATRESVNRALRALARRGVI